ncbi:tRNA 4-thiouridine(8) synthase ThiI [Patescibacteria group bacterium]|nr:tRNA 4-thiouridine(8) synthase ThiI [Patescibacteria group bacterium]
MKKIKALVLFSGGLDSLLAMKLLQEQDISVTALIFKSYFFSSKKAEKNAKQLNVPVIVSDISKKHLEVVKNPASGHGKAANPCIDCHLLMLRQAKKIAEKRGFDLIATGEVLGERPFSQNKNALEKIKKNSGLSEILLRPLSAKLLEPTILEEKGLINRERLEAISGRSRKRQLELAKKYKLKFPTPGGGCILTEKEFGKKLFDLFEKQPDFEENDLKLLFFGRHFWNNNTKIVIGRNKEENEKLKKLFQKGDILIEPEFPGPTALISGKSSKENIAKAKTLILKYSKPPSKKLFKIKA